MYACKAFEPYVPYRISALQYSIDIVDSWSILTSDVKPYSI